MVGQAVIALAIMIAALAIVMQMRKHDEMFYYASMKAALLSNFSRFGEVDPERLVVVDDARAYFIRDTALWVCDVHDDMLLRQTTRPVDMMTASGEELKEVMAVVDALNAELEEE